MIVNRVYGLFVASNPALFQDTDGNLIAIIYEDFIPFSSHFELKYTGLFQRVTASDTASSIPAQFLINITDRKKQDPPGARVL